MSKQPGSQTFAVVRCQQGQPEPVEDLLAQEVAVALVYNGLSHVVMMATPLNLEEFALGFSLSEGIIERVEQFYSAEVTEHPLGIEVQIEISTECFAKLKQHRRNLAGRSGCGLCGTESLQQAIGAARPVEAVALPDTAAIEHALEALRQHQPLKQATGAVHGVALCNRAGEILLTREDVGRHNALDKLLGSIAQHREAYPANADSFVLISSRASYEMVSKCNVLGISTLVAVSAPTALATELAKGAGMNLIGFARPGRHIIYTQSPHLDNHPNFV